MNVTECAVGGPVGGLVNIFDSPRLPPMFRMLMRCCVSHRLGSARLGRNKSSFERPPCGTPGPRAVVAVVSPWAHRSRTHPGAIAIDLNKISYIYET